MDVDELRSRDYALFAVWYETIQFHRELTCASLNALKPRVINALVSRTSAVLEPATAASTTAAVTGFEGTARRACCLWCSHVDSRRRAWDTVHLFGVAVGIFLAFTIFWWSLRVTIKFTQYGARFLPSCRGRSGDRCHWKAGIGKQKVRCYTHNTPFALDHKTIELAANLLVQAFRPSLHV